MVCFAVRGLARLALVPILAKQVGRRNAVRGRQLLDGFDTRTGELGQETQASEGPEARAGSDGGDKARTAMPTGEARLEGGPEDVAAVVTSAEERLVELDDAYKRLVADFANYRRRMDREQARWGEAARGDLVRGFLNVFDTLELARASAERAETRVTDLRSGLDMVLRQLYETLASQGVQTVAEVGTPYDPSTCEAIGEDDVPDVVPGTITTVLRAGYKMGERLLRPALVRVAAMGGAAAGSSGVSEPATEPVPSRTGTDPSVDAQTETDESHAPGR